MKNNNKNTIIRVVAACGLIFTLTACSNQQNTQTVDITSQSTVSEFVSVSESSLSSSTSKGKKLSGKYNNIKLGDKVIKLPFSIKELGDGYSISSSSIEYFENNDDTFNAKFDIVHDGVKVFKARVKNVADYSQRDNVDLSEIEIVGIEQQYVPKNGEALSVNNVAVGDEPDKVIDNLGTPDKTLKGSYIYYDDGEADKGVLFFVFDDNEGIYYIRRDFAE